MAKGVEHGGLHRNLRGHDPLPCLFRKGRLGLELRAHTSALCMVTLKRKQDGPRRMIGAADDDWAASIPEFCQKRPRQRDAMCMEQDGGYFVQRNAPDFGTILLNQKKTTDTGQVTPVRGDINDTVQILAPNRWKRGRIYRSARPDQCFGGPGSLMRPISST